MISRLVQGGLALAAFAAGACNLGGTVALDGGADAAPETASDGTVGEDARTEPVVDGGDGGPGPITLVGTHFEALTERVCDLDGDGHQDNALADLGNPGAEIVATALTALLNGTLAQGRRWLSHCPHVEDRRGPNEPHAVVAFFGGEDGDDFNELGIREYGPVDPSDDFSGDELFYASAASLDRCGEPKSFAADLRIADGHMEGALDEVGIRVDDFRDLVLRNGRASGEVSPFGTGGVFVLCGSVLLGEIGALPYDDDTHTILELFVGGGAALGYPGVPGVSPDLDLDGDGLERIVLDGDGLVSSCIDGDGTTIEGRDCWADGRIADGISAVVEITMTSARFAGRTPFWRRAHQGTCLHLMRCARADGDECLDRDPCDEANAARADAFETCVAASECSAECIQSADVGWTDCWRCAHDHCPDEAAACLESDCCDDPPDASLWDPR